VQLILGHHRRDGRHLRHLMPVRLGIVTLQGVLTAGALPGLDGHDVIHLRHRHQHPALALMARLPSALPSARHPTSALSNRLRGITRRRPRRVRRVLLETLQQLLDGRFQCSDTRFKGADILLDGDRRLLQAFWWEGWYGVHEPRSYVAGNRLASLTYCDHVNAYERLR